MLVTKTYIEKSNTIQKDSNVNLSLNPILELNYGNMLTRGLIYFDHTKLKCMVEDKIYPDTTKFKHVLKMKNTASITTHQINKPCLTSEYNDTKERALSFDVILFLIPNEWDSGRGFDYVCDLYDNSHRSISIQGSNWYQYKNYLKWQTEGIYSIDMLLKEYDKFSSKNGNVSNIIIARQHFEYGNENLEIDITETVNKFISGELPNNGIGIAFAPYYENLETKKSQYVGFFTNSTHSFFKPYVETIYNEFIEDDRTNFYLDKDNKLYFYASVGGNPVNLDETPTCTIDGLEMAVKQATKGVYYCEVNLSSKDYDDDTMLYDIWGNIIYNGKQFDDVELPFVTKQSSSYFSFGLSNNNDLNKTIDCVPSLYGINDCEQIKQGDIRKINVDCKIPYSSDKKTAVDGLYYRVYIKEGENQIDVIDWLPIERGYNENFFYLNTNDFVPFRYYVDVKIHQGNEIKILNELLEFDIIDNITDKTN